MKHTNLIFTQANNQSVSEFQTNNVNYLAQEDHRGETEQ